MRRAGGAIGVAAAIAAFFGLQACGPQERAVGGRVDGNDNGVGPQATSGAARSEGPPQGLRYPVATAPQAWAGWQKLRASDGGIEAYFGHSVALDGDTAVVGANFDDAQGLYAGAAYVFVRAASAWTEQDKLLPSDGAARKQFGLTVALDGDTIVIGAPYDNAQGGRAGSAYVFVRTASAWTEQDKLLASDGAAADQFGVSVSLSGKTALVGAHYDDDGGNSAGSAYVFERSAANWAQQSKLLASDGSADDQLGGSTALDGDTAIVGAVSDDAQGSGSGSAYVFVRAAAVWAEQDKLLASDGVASHVFGTSIALRGGAALVGARGDAEAGAFAGAAYVFVRNAANWSQQDKLLASDGVAGDGFGWSVSLSGTTALVGASERDEGGASAGAAYVFERTATSWAPREKLLAGDGAEEAFFGRAVSLSGATALIGAFRADAPAADSGAAYLFAFGLVEGQPCGADAACAGKSCANGVCCDTACEGSCEACHLSGLEGVCTTLPRGSAPTPSCGGYLCGGLVAGCPQSCVGEPDCAPAYHCPNAIVCAPKEVDGRACAAHGGCLSGHCVDGLCCAQACDDGCGSCLGAGSEGVCMPLDAGHPGTPSCAPYLCGGGDTSCPQSCADTDDCAHAHHCEEGACQPNEALGASCTESDACASGHCRDSVCCAVASCGAYRCGPEGVCEAACSSSAQCASGHECNSEHHCEERAAGAGAADRACHLTGVAAGGSRSSRWPGAMAWLACLVVIRRRRSVLTR